MEKSHHGNSLVSVDKDQLGLDVFQVHLKGDLAEFVPHLKHVWDRWEYQLFLVSTEDQMEQAKERYRSLLGILNRLNCFQYRSSVSFIEGH